MMPKEVMSVLEKLENVDDLEDVALSLSPKKLTMSAGELVYISQLFALFVRDQIFKESVSIRLATKIHKQAEVMMGDLGIKYLELKVPEIAAKLEELKAADVTIEIEGHALIPMIAEMIPYETIFVIKGGYAASAWKKLTELSWRVVEEVGSILKNRQEFSTAGANMKPAQA